MPNGRPRLPQEEEDEEWFRPVWETEDETDLEPPARSLRRTIDAKEPGYDHPLLAPLAKAQHLMTRLETRIEIASAPVVEGLLNRMAYLEASGWISHTHVWIHPMDLARRDRGLAGSYGPAFREGKLSALIPLTIAAESEFEEPPSDIIVDQALRMARLWRRLAELRTWRPLDDVAETLEMLGSGAAPITAIDDWISGVSNSARFPTLIRAGLAARDWDNQPGVNPKSPAAIILASCVWREGLPRHRIPLPLWAAPELRHNRLELKTGVEWMAVFLNSVADAARVGIAELDRLQHAADKGRDLGGTKRSRLSAALDVALRVPFVTASDVVTSLNVSFPAALKFLQDLKKAGVIREATSRKSWRAYSIV
jgi:hypothetical protein